MDAILRYSKKILMRTLMLPLRLLPLRRNRVVLLNALARNYGDNPKSVAEYLIDQYPGKLQIIIPVKDPAAYGHLAEKGLTVVKYNSVKYFYYAMTCQVFLTNSGGFSYLPMRKKQYIINTWHGGGAYKKCGLDMYEDTKLFRKDLKLTADKTDVFLSTCQKFTEVSSCSLLTPK